MKKPRRARAHARSHVHSPAHRNPDESETPESETPASETPASEDEGEDTPTETCEHCNEEKPEDDLADVSVGANETESWCQDCRDSTDCGTCEHCDHETEVGALQTVLTDSGNPRRRQQWCEACIDSTASACERSSCDNYVVDDERTTVDGDEWCPECVNDHSTTCGYCDDRTDSGETRTVYCGRREDEQEWCTSCYENNAHWCETCDQYYDERAYGNNHDHDSDEDEDDGDGGRSSSSSAPSSRNYNYPGSTTSRSIGFRGDQWPLIRQYHASQGVNVSASNRIPFKPIDSEWVRRQPKPLWFGVELEVKVPNGESLDKYAFKVHDSIGPRYGDFLLYDIQHDGSLGGRGFEIIPQPAGLDVHAERWPVADLKDLRGHDVKGCGLHIHFTKAAMKQTTDADGNIRYPAVGRMGAFIYARENKEFLEKFARRTFEEVSAHVHRVAGYRIPMGTSARSSHYEALNLSNRDTFEFRLPRSTTKVSTILASVEFVFLLIRFCEGAANTALTADAFKRFIAEDRWAKDSRHLRAYLVDRGLATAQEMRLPRPRPVRPNPARRVSLHGDTPGYYAKMILAEDRQERRRRGLPW